MSEDRIPTFIPGDQLEYQLVFTCEVNARAVTAAFRNETTGAEIVLQGEARMIDKPRVKGTRTFAALLEADEGTSDWAATGRYRLARLEVETYRGKTLDFDNPIEDAFRFEEEPEDLPLPRLARGLVEPVSTFVLPPGHPNALPER
jgi:hypothetical protein